MLKRLVQATIITLLLNLIFGLSSNTNQVMSSKAEYPANTDSGPVVSLLVRSLK
ncbi:MAG: hypothetical protein KI793_13795 [Rivularia sp. (in: Bacteria)]|nr:hypothetical protein [Rivularia sp. MS3]